MATDAETLVTAINKLNSLLAPLGKFVDAWTQREQRPGLYNKFPVATPFRPHANQTIVMPITAANTVSDSLNDGFYHLAATNDCFISLNQPANINGAGTTTISSYPLFAGLVYGPVRMTRQDKINLIALAAAGFLFISQVE